MPRWCKGKRICLKSERSKLSPMFLPRMAQNSGSCGIYLEKNGSSNTYTNWDWIGVKNSLAISFHGLQSFTARINVLYHLNNFNLFLIFRVKFNSDFITQKCFHYRDSNPLALTITVFQYSMNAFRYEGNNLGHTFECVHTTEYACIGFS